MCFYCLKLCTIKLVYFCTEERLVCPAQRQLLLTQSQCDADMLSPVAALCRHSLHMAGSPSKCLSHLPLTANTTNWDETPSDNHSSHANYY
jgi:hypothetical protein